MTEAERDELIDLYVDDALPETLRAGVEAHLAAHPEAAADVASLSAAIKSLQTATGDKPDAWFAERTLDRLLREHAAADIETIFVKTK